MAGPRWQYFAYHLVLQSTAVATVGSALLIWSGNAIFRSSTVSSSSRGNTTTYDLDPKRWHRFLFGLLSASGVLLTLTSGLCTIYTGGEFLVQIRHYTGGPGEGGYAFGLAPIFINTGTVLILCGVAIYCGGRAVLRRQAVAGNPNQP
jgi:hypothetical protein